MKKKIPTTIISISLPAFVGVLVGLLVLASVDWRVAVGVFLVFLFGGMVVRAENVL